GNQEIGVNLGGLEHGTGEPSDLAERPAGAFEERGIGITHRALLPESAGGAVGAAPTLTGATRQRPAFRLILRGDPALEHEGIVGGDSVSRHHEEFGTCRSRLLGWMFHFRSRRGLDHGRSWEYDEPPEVIH